MKAYKYLLAGVCSMFMFSSCLEEFQKLNTDKEQLGETDPAAIFTGATKDYQNRGRGHLTGKYSGVMSIMQYLVSSGGASNGIYINPEKPNEHPSPSNQSYSDYYGYTGLYLNHLVNDVIPNHAEKERYAAIQAIAQILLSHQQWSVLDCYGAAPITEAFKVGAGIRTPQYDLYQKSINGEPMYKIIDADVKKAVATLKASGDNQYKLDKNDFFYNGDVAKWIKFGNTLRVLMAQRLEKADASFYNTVINDVLTSADNVIASNEESCIYHHTNDYNDNPDDIQDITSRYVASAAFVNYLVAYNDPRLPIMVRPNGFGLGNNNKTNDEWFETFKKEYPDYETTYARYAANRYIGMSANPDSAESLTAGQAYLTLPYHKEDGSEANLEIRMYSQAEGRYFIKNGGKNGNNNMPAREIESSEYEKDLQSMHDLTPIITYPQTCLMLAEIAVKKGAAVAGKTATEWMKAGIKASMEQYREWAEVRFVVAQTATTSPTYNPVTDEEIEAYLAQSEFQEATLEKIISQQWINLYKQPEEMWAVWKRTGLPAFKAQPTPENGVAFFEEIKLAGAELTIPRRNQLGTPNTLNIDNYNAAVQQLCQDAKYGAGVANTEGRIWWDAE
jgi:hypothetical protein